VISRGAAGSPPRGLDQVYELAGYAAFRSGWDRDAITGHFSCNHLGAAHYHRDETTFELYGHGAELVVDAGKFDYDHDGANWKYQTDVYAHNVLIVDGASYYPPEGPHIVAHGGDDTTVWVQGTHAGYRDRGVSSQVRTFAYARPDSFAIIDSVRAGGHHDYAQHFHLAPGLTAEVVDDHTVIATGAATMVIAAVGTAPTRIELAPSKYFPSWGVETAITDIVFHHEGGDATLPVIITIAPPGAPPRLPEAPTFTDSATEMVLRWTAGGTERQVNVPAAAIAR
jgi:hypothetical protein